jgi:hypothetical protein
MCASDGRLDAPPVRPAESHVPLVLQQLHLRKPFEVGVDERGGVVAAAVVDHEDLVRQRERLERARDVLERRQNILALVVGGDDDRQRIARARARSPASKARYTLARQRAMLPAPALLLRVIAGVLVGAAAWPALHAVLRGCRS